MLKVTRSATFTVPAGPPLKGLMPKSVCLIANVASARNVSTPGSTLTSIGTSRVWPTSVSAPMMWNPCAVGLTSFETSRISWYWSMRRVSVRMASVTLRISAVSGGVSTSRLSVWTVIWRWDRAAA